MTKTPLITAITLGLFAFGACTPVSPTGDTGSIAIEELPEDIVQLLDPSQDLSDVRVLPEDGCYWYRHIGPVETTYLPLLTRQERRICTEAASEMAAAAAEAAAAQAATDATPPAI